MQGEEKAIETVIKAGDQYGYGNMIAHLKRVWAENLRDKWGLPEKAALEATNVSAYPLRKKEKRLNIEREDFI
ncbi:MAG: hypothetical protein ABFD06_00100 [Smithella sp.]|jgi:hypothetical protein